MNRLDEIKTRLEKATPGPWRVAVDKIEPGDPVSYPRERAEVRGNECDMTYCEVCRFEERVAGVPFCDADFIAHSRADLEWAVAEIERLRAELAAKDPSNA